MLARTRFTSLSLQFYPTDFQNSNAILKVLVCDSNVQLVILWFDRPFNFYWTFNLSMRYRKKISKNCWLLNQVTSSCFAAVTAIVQGVTEFFVPLGVQGVSKISVWVCVNEMAGVWLRVNKMAALTLYNQNGRQVSLCKQNNHQVISCKQNNCHLTLCKQNCRQVSSCKKFDVKKFAKLLAVPIDQGIRQIVQISGSSICFVSS